MFWEKTHTPPPTAPKGPFRGQKRKTKPCSVSKTWDKLSGSEALNRERSSGMGWKVRRRFWWGSGKEEDNPQCLVAPGKWCTLFFPLCRNGQLFSFKVGKEIVEHKNGSEEAQATRKTHVGQSLRVVKGPRKSPVTCWCHVYMEDSLRLEGICCLLWQKQWQ